MFPTICFTWVLCWGTYYLQQEAELVGYDMQLLEQARQMTDRAERLLLGASPMQRQRPASLPPRPVPPKR